MLTNGDRRLVNLMMREILHSHTSDDEQGTVNEVVVIFRLYTDPQTIDVFRLYDLNLVKPSLIKTSTEEDSHFTPRLEKR